MPGMRIPQPYQVSTTCNFLAHGMSDMRAPQQSRPASPQDPCHARHKASSMPGSTMPGSHNLHLPRAHTSHEVPITMPCFHSLHLRRIQARHEAPTTMPGSQTFISPASMHYARLPKPTSLRIPAMPRMGLSQPYQSPTTFISSGSIPCHA